MKKSIVSVLVASGATAILAFLAVTGCKKADYQVVKSDSIVVEDTVKKVSDSVVLDTVAVVK